jgi:hypothetical protein
MTNTENKDSGTIFGSHECHFDKFENLPSPSEKNLPLTVIKIIDTKWWRIIAKVQFVK